MCRACKLELSARGRGHHRARGPACRRHTLSSARRDGTTAGLCGGPKGKMQRKQFICALTAPSPAACARSWHSRDCTHQDQSARRRVGWGRFIGRTCGPRTVAPCSTDAERAARAGDDRCCNLASRSQVRLARGSGGARLVLQRGALARQHPEVTHVLLVSPRPPSLPFNQPAPWCRGTRRRLFGRHTQEVRPPPRVKLPQPWPTRAKVRVTERIAAPPSHG